MTNELVLYERSKDFLWTDTYIAKQMLRYHLDPETDAASRGPKAIDATVNWLCASLQPGTRIADLGCGPGLYTERLARRGLLVDGFDISRSSIQYARRQAILNKLPIRYHQQSYLTQPISGNYDTALCIYCDFGALIPEEQTRFLKNVRASLPRGGRLVFDVFGLGLGLLKKEERSWTYVDKEDFWSPKPHHILFEQKYFSDAQAWGSRHRIIEKSRTREFITWDTLYTDTRISELLSKHGFLVEELKHNLIPQNDFAGNDVIFVKARASD